MLIAWLASTPILSFYIRYPIKQSIITFDRIAILLLIIFFVKENYKKEFLSTLKLGIFELAWISFCGLTILNLLFHSESSGFAWKTSLDSFCLPILPFIAAKQGIKTNQFGKISIVFLFGLSLILFSIGIYEFGMQEDLFQYPGGMLFHDGFVRANGPFESNNSYALISLILALILWYWPQLNQVGGVEKIISRFGFILAAGASAIPLFRTIWIVLGICIVTPMLLGENIKQRRRALSIVLASGVILFSVGKIIEQTEFYKSRISNLENAYTRIATYQAATFVFFDHWMTGVGLTKYTEVYNKVYYNEDDYNRKYPIFYGETPRDSPHNNVLSVFAELGILAGSLYIIAHLILLFESIVMCHSHNIKTKIAGRISIALWLAYWIPGMTLSSGYYSDLNFYFFTFYGIMLGINKNS